MSLMIQERQRSNHDWTNGTDDHKETNKLKHLEHSLNLYSSEQQKDLSYAFNTHLVIGYGRCSDDA